jgi:hypothetical protein
MIQFRLPIADCRFVFEIGNQKLAIDNYLPVLPGFNLIGTPA